MNTLLLSKTDEAYLQKCATEHKFAYGIIIGQQAEPEKFIVVHLAKNGEEEVELEAAAADEPASQGPQQVMDIDLQALTNQWISANKMIPGSFVVLGIFVSSTNDDIADEENFKSAKKLLYDVHNLLTQGNNFIGSFADNVVMDYVLLVYAASSRQAIAKTYAVSDNGGTFAPMDCRFVEKPFEWHSFECNYELDDIFPIVDDTHKINIEKQFQRTIDAVKSNLKASEIFIQNETVDEKLSLIGYIKQRQGKQLAANKSAAGVSTTALNSSSNEHQHIRACIYLPVHCQLSIAHPIKVKEFNGTIRFSGVISSRIWCNPKNTLGDVKRFLRDDILRSLVARIQVYCDGLTATNVSKEAIFISEPPRRVYFSLHTAAASASMESSGDKKAGGGPAYTNAIQFSEYIFRGEAPTVAVAQAKQILDLDISTDNICADVEGLPDDDTFSDMSSDLLTPPTSVVGSGARDLTRTMYMLGIVVALLVLIMSILLHYLIR